MLSKDFQRVLIPGAPGRPEVLPQPERTICQDPPQGRWVYKCERIDVPDNSSVTIPPGGEIVVVYDPDGEIDPLTGQVKVIDMYIRVCTSVWVPEPNNSGPVCITYPAVPYQPEVPQTYPRYEYSPVLAWDAGANSLQRHLGNCEAKWVMGRVVGAYIGLTTDRAAVPAVNRLTHAFMFHQRAGVPYFRVVESGRGRSSDQPYVAGDEFSIRRANGVVSYWRNGEMLQVSASASVGRVSVGSALYASGDALPTSEVVQ